MIKPILFEVHCDGGCGDCIETEEPSSVPKDWVRKMDENLGVMKDFCDKCAPKYDEQMIEKFPSTVLVHWATGEVACCDDHAQGLLKIGKVMVCHVPVTKLIEPIACINCINENQNKEKK